MSTAPAGAADPTLAFNWKIDASTHLKKLNMDVTVPTGTFTGSVDLATGDLTGDITLPPATVSFAGLANAQMQIVEAQPVTGHVDLTTFAVTATSTFNIHVVSASPALLPFLNLVGNNCTTATPVTVTMTGTANLTGPSTFSGPYTIPPFAHCQLATLVLTLAVSGPGNTFTATASPAT